MTSGMRAAMRLASSCTVMVSGRVTSRTTLTPSVAAAGPPAPADDARARVGGGRMARLRLLSSSPSMAAMHVDAAERGGVRRAS